MSKRSRFVAFRCRIGVHRWWLALSPGFWDGTLFCRDCRLIYGAAPEAIR